MRHIKYAVVIEQRRGDIRAFALGPFADEGKARDAMRVWAEGEHEVPGDAINAADDWGLECAAYSAHIVPMFAGALQIVEKALIP